ncbi:MAG: chorismate-binding protein [Spirochaetia bacterium]|nr:chorismate-binding protein [Spirochaetia bacterium]
MSAKETSVWPALPPDSVLIESAAGPRLFRDPERIIVAHNSAEIPSALDRLNAAANDGLFTAGFFSYDDARDLFARPIPLIWFGCYKSWTPFTYPAWHDGFALKRTETLEEELSARQEFLESVQSIRKGIESGLYYQVNYTRRERFEFEGSPFSLFRRLLELQKGRYAAYVNTDQIQLLSLSPELFFSIESEVHDLELLPGTTPGKEAKSQVPNPVRILRAHPMKGTAGRDFDPLFLSADEKSRAENFMIVDLMRNDIGRVAKTGSVEVEALAKVEQLSTVQQMISIVRGELDSPTGYSQLYNALFPPGSVTGAPKLAALRMIESLEASRGAYTGAIGFSEPHMNAASFNVAIRTLQIQDSNAVYGSGCGIVWDSKPELEWNEYLLKKAFLRAAQTEFHLIETMRLENGRIDLLSGHLARLKRSAEVFSLGLPLREILEDIQIHLEQSRERRAHPQRVRLALYQNNRFEIQAEPSPQPIDRGLRLLLSSHQIDSQDIFRRHKSSERRMYDRELQLAREQGFDDVLFLNEREEVVETAIGNVLISKDDGFHTPPIDSGALPGVFLEGLAKQKHVVRRPIPRSEMTQIGFVCNALRGLMNVQSISE